VTDPTPDTAFPEVSFDEWRARVVDELGDADFARALVSRLPGGIEVQPLYARSPDTPDDPAGLPGMPPATRGATPGGTSGGWEIVEHGEEPALHDPLGELARTGAVSGGLDAAFAEPEAPFGVSTVPHHDAGATAVQELAFALATGVEYLRRLEAAGIEPAASAARLTFRFAIDRDLFAEIAKLRAARALWSRVLAACGLDAPSPMRIHAVTSARTLARRDPWTNMLRVTTQVFAAICGGADTITAAPFDAALGEPGELGRRLARNTQTILAEEGHVGEVVDPAGGSWYVEELTERMARLAWDEFRSLEAVGGMTRALLDGEVRRRLDASWEERLADLAIRRIPVTGISEFPDTDALLDRDAPPAETDGGGERLVEPLPRRRDAAPFEALRDTADARPVRPAVYLANLGPPVEHRARAVFAENLFRIGGFDVAQGDGAGDADPPANARELVEGFQASGASFACLCGADSRYPEAVPGAAEALKAAGARAVLVAGRAGEHEAAWRTAGVDDFVHLGMDVLELLGRLLVAGGAR